MLINDWKITEELHISYLNSSTNHSEMSCCFYMSLLLSLSIFFWLRFTHKKSRTVYDILACVCVR